MTRRWIPLVAWLVAGCAYYNGIYNAKASARSGDRQVARGESNAASQAYSISATTAETVLARHPRTRWRTDALYYAARGYALAGECARGMRRLDEYMAIGGQPQARRDRALIARAACLVTNKQLLPADSILTPLLLSGDKDVRNQAALFAGRAALQLGDADRAASLLAQVPGSAAAWEFVAAAIQKGDFAKAESLLVARARAGDWRSEVHQHVGTLWAAGSRAAAVHVVDLYGVSSAPTPERVRLRFLASDLAAAVGDTALARRQAIEAQRLGFSSTGDAEARARLLALRIREFDVLADVDAAVARDSGRARGTPLLKRIKDNLTMVHMFELGPNRDGAGVFLAAEIVRDSLSAYALAHAMFRSIERDIPDSRLIGRALLASRRMFPESTAVYDARILEKFPQSSAAVRLAGGDPSESTLRIEDKYLEQSWQVVMAQWGDTLKARKMADSIAAATGSRRQ